ncbi:MAG: c-type cytochrome [Solirubrobacterales bacterium]
MRAVLAVGVVLVLIVLGGLAYLYSGAADVAADSPHLAALNGLLDTARRQSVRTHSQGIQVPSLDEPGMLEDGVRHYAGHCAMCHGAPGVEPQGFAGSMYPVPAKLVEAVRRWSPAELFWIVNHGFEFTGMPAWGGVHVEGEVWAIVAFLRQMPSMDPARYQEIVAPPKPEPEPVPELSPEQPAPPPNEGEDMPPAPPEPANPVPPPAEQAPSEAQPPAPTQPDNAPMRLQPER